MKFITTLLTAGAILMATVSAAPTPQFGGSLEDRQFGGDIKAGDKRTPQWGGKQYELDGAIYTPSHPAKPITVPRQWGGSTDEKHQWGGSSSNNVEVAARQFGGDADVKRQFGGSTDEKREAQFGGSTDEKREAQFGGSSDKRQWGGSTSDNVEVTARQYGGNSDKRQFGGDADKKRQWGGSSE